MRFIILLTIFTPYVIAHPIVESGVFVIQGVTSCQNGTGYCILGSSCDIDSDFSDELDGHCNGLINAFTPQAEFVCCRYSPIDKTTTDVPTTIDTYTVTGKFDLIDSQPNDYDEEGDIPEDVDPSSLIDIVGVVTDHTAVIGYITKPYQRPISTTAMATSVTSTPASTVPSFTEISTSSTTETLEEEFIEIPSDIYNEFPLIDLRDNLEEETTTIPVEDQNKRTQQIEFRMSSPLESPKDSQSSLILLTKEGNYIHALDYMDEISRNRLESIELGDYSLDGYKDHEHQQKQEQNDQQHNEMPHNSGNYSENEISRRTDEKNPEILNDKQRGTEMPNVNQDIPDNMGFNSSKPVIKLEVNTTEINTDDFEDILEEIVEDIRSKIPVKKVENPNIFSQNTECGNKRPISMDTIRGTNGSMEWCWVVAIMEIRANDYKYLCTGVLTHPNIVVTTAACISRLQDPSNYVVQVGSPKLEDKGFNQYGIESQASHPQFDTSGGASVYDIGLIKLRRHVPLTENVCTICLQEASIEDTNASSEECRAVGYNVKSIARFYGDPYRTLANLRPLKEVSFKMDPKLVCKQELFMSPYATLAPNSHTLLCGHETARLGAPTTCETTVDRGSPLACRKNKIWYLKGLKSWTQGCRKNIHKDIYVDVEYFSNWMKDWIAAWSSDSDVLITIRE